NHSSFLFPHYTFTEWPYIEGNSYDERVQTMEDAGKKVEWRQKNDQLFWRGKSNDIITSHADTHITVHTLTIPSHIEAKSESESESDLDSQSQLDSSSLSRS